MSMEEQTAPLETGDPASDSRAFRRALGQFATGVTVVTAAHEGQAAGLTVNSFASVSLDPPLVLCSLARTSRSLAVFQRAQHLGVNVLAAEQVALAGTFAGPAADKFGQVAWRAGLGGVPLFDGVAATLECRIAQRLEGGDHVIYLCEVLRYTRHGRPLLLYANGRFGLVMDYPQEPGEPEPAMAYDSANNMLQLLWNAWSRFSHEFQAARDAEGLSIDQGRVLSHVQQHPGETAEYIARHAFLGERLTEDTLASLAAAGLITPQGRGSYALTRAGEERLDALRQRAAELEALQLEDIPAEDMKVVRRVLRKLGVPGPLPGAAPKA